VDAGCGTGLCGPALRPYARQLAGCDLSEGMLRRAWSRQVYDVLHKAELTFYLETQPEAFDAVISADTLCYFGALEVALAAARRCLRPGGWLIFTVEALPEGHAESHVLQTNGRYAHARSYLEQAMRATSLEPVAIVSDTLRQESGEAVVGWLVTARRSSS
jgi:predicted TPR repeat methyltransferase